MYLDAVMTSFPGYNVIEKKQSGIKNIYSALSFTKEREYIFPLILRSQLKYKK